MPTIRCRSFIRIYICFLSDDIAISEAISAVEREIRRSRGSSFQRFIVKGAEVDLSDLEEEFVEIGKVSSIRNQGNKKDDDPRTQEGDACIHGASVLNVFIR